MKSTSRPAADRPRAGRRRLPRDTGRWLVRIDQRPLRRQAATECRRELVRLEKARAEWERFDREDKPAFQRWVASRFGAQLTEIRELELALREKERLIDEVEIEYAWIGASSYRAAYHAVMRRRDSGAPRRPAPEEAKTEPPPDFAQFSTEQKREVFEDFLEDYCGIDPGDLSKKEYQRMYREFAAGMGKEARQSAPSPAPDAPARPDDVRIKEIYRVLVRRLHPDARGEGEADVTALWHEVQEAYLSGNRERLELLLALTDIRSRTVGEQTSLFQMREVLAELRQAFAAVQESLRSARKNPAWKFTRGARRAVLEVRLQRRFAADIAGRRKRLRACESLIARWAKPLKARRSWISDLQIEFGF